MRLPQQLLGCLIVLLCCATAGAGELTVSAAMSLSDAFRDICRDYEAVHPGAKIWLNAGASGTLLRQIENGAPVDVFASADVDTMTSAVESQTVTSGTSTVFATNRLVIITPAKSPIELKTLRDLTAPAVKRIAIGNPDSVPAGRYAMHSLKNSGLWTGVQTKLTYSENVRQALTYVVQGEVDAGLVYATDARMAGDRVKICADVPTSASVQYTIAPVRGAKNEDGAAAFIGYVLSAPGQETLKRYGFHSPK